MAINFNQYPYNDDYLNDSVTNTHTKNFHRILFKSGVSVQARELTQTQSILQGQIKKFGDHIFDNHTLVSGAGITTNFGVYFLKLEEFDLNGSPFNVDSFLGKTITDVTGNIEAKVVYTFFDSVPVVIISYLSDSKFYSGQAVYAKNSELTAQVIAETSALQPATGLSSICSIDNGVYYIDGFFVDVFKQTITIDPYSNKTSARIGLSVAESIVTSVEDTSLLDPALGAFNFQAPGADRYKIQLTLVKKPLTLDADTTFIEILRIEEGKIASQAKFTQYSEIDNYFARRTFDTNGNFIVDKYTVNVAENPADANAETYLVKLGPGKSYVNGFINENQTALFLVADKARTYNTVNNKILFMNYGNYLYTNNVRGTIDFSNYQKVDLHCVKNANTSNLSAYQSTIAASGRIKNMKFSKYTSSSNASSYVYETYFVDIQNNVLSGNTVGVNLANSVTNTSANVTFESNFSEETDAYKGVYLRVDSGNDAGDVLKISSYSGTSKVASLEKNFISDPGASFAFSLLFDTKDFESFYDSNTSISNGLTSNTSYAAIYPSSKNPAIESGDTYLRNVSDDDLLYELGNDFVVQNSLGNTEYYTWMKFTNQNMGTPMNVPGSSVFAFNGSDGLLSDSDAATNFIVVSKTTGLLVPFSSSTLQVTLSASSTQATLSGTSAVGNADVYGKVKVLDGNNTSYSKRLKTLVSGRTDIIDTLSSVTGATGNYINSSSGQFKVLKANFNSTKQSLYIADVTRIVKIIDTKTTGATVTTSMLSDSSYDITNSFNFDNGQNDHYYDHASIKLYPNAPIPSGDVFVVFDYYDHSGDGYFDASSYQSPVTYADIPSYTNKKGITYELRDVVDFRKTRSPATATFQIVEAKTPPTGIPVDGTTFQTDFSYYLGRKDLLIVGKDNDYKLIQGEPSLYPIEPNQPDGSMTIAKFELDPYTVRISSDNRGSKYASIKIQTMIHKRWRMEDITSLEDRVTRVEYYSTLNALELAAKSLQIPDETGTNRFKNGILVDDFSTYTIANFESPDFYASIQTAKTRLYSVHNVRNFDLALREGLQTFGRMDPTSKSALGYGIDYDGEDAYITLPYEKVLAARQPYASAVVNVNPFNVIDVEGQINLSPKFDAWVSTERLPDINLTIEAGSSTITTTNINTSNNTSTISGSTTPIRRSDVRLNSRSITSTSGMVVSSSAGGVDIADFGVVFGSTRPTRLNSGDFQTIGGADVRSQSTSTTTTTTTTTTTATASSVNGISVTGQNQLSDGFVTDASLYPWIRGQQVGFTAFGMLKNTLVKVYFDDVNVTDRVRETNSIWIDTANSGNFTAGDIIAPTGSQPTGKILDVSLIETYLEGSEKRYVYECDLIADLDINSYGSSISSNVINSVYISPTGTQTVKGTGTITQIQRNSGRILSVSGNTAIIRRFYEGEANNIVSGSELTIICENIGNANTANGETDILYVYNIENALEDSGNNIITLYCSETILPNVNYNSKTTSEKKNYVYSIKKGSYILTNKKGSVSGVFYLPKDTYHTGDRVFRIDNRIAENKGTETTFSETKFFATNLHYVKRGLDIDFPPPPPIPPTPPTPPTPPFPCADPIAVAGYASTTANQTMGKTIGITYPTVLLPKGSIVTGYRLKWKNVRFKAGYNEQLGTNYPIDLDEFDTDTIVLGSGEVHKEGLASVFSERLTVVSTYYVTDPNCGTARNVKVYNPVDPVAQTFIFYKDEYPFGCFVKSIKTFFRSKPDDGGAPITCYISETQSGIPTKVALPHASKTLSPEEVMISDSPAVWDENTYTEFEFPVPVYIEPEKLYSFTLKSDVEDYEAYTARLGDVALPSSTTLSSTDAQQTSFKISKTPYIGELFKSQNTISWNSDGNEDLMFVIERCDFDTSQTPKIEFVVPKYLPERKLMDNVFDFTYGANTDINVAYTSNTNFLVDAFDVSTTDLTFTEAPIKYSYRATINNGLQKESSATSISPGKYGSTNFQEIMLDDGNGERVLTPNTLPSGAYSFSLYADLSSTRPELSPMISEMGLSLFGIQWDINDLDIANTDIQLVDGGAGYAANSDFPLNLIRTSNNVSSNVIIGTDAQIRANTNASGNIARVYITTGGSQYASTPLVNDLNVTGKTPGTANAVILIGGETNSVGGNGVLRYISKPVTLASGFDAGDLRVYYTAYRPVNTNIYVYYKILNRNDIQNFDDSDWQLMTTISGASTFSKKRGQLYEYVAAPYVEPNIGVASNKVSYTSKINGQSYTNFAKFAIKVVMSSNDATVIPYLEDIRTIALLPIGL